MDQRTLPSPRIKPLPPEQSPELKDQFEAMRKNLGFIPNSILIMQRKPKLAKALAQMTAAVWDPEGDVARAANIASSPETYDALARALLSRRQPTTIHTYPEAEHGFMHRPTPEANVAATRLASPPLLAFLRTCLN